MSEFLLESKNLKKFFKTPHGTLHAVDGIRLKLKKGRTLGVAGESGCGKSTLARLIVRLLEPTSGEVLFKGENILNLKRQGLKQIRQKMQIIFQDPYASLNPRLAVHEIISEPLRIYQRYSDKDDLRSKVLAIMDRVGLSQRQMNCYPHELDGGRRQRIGIARALVLEPELIVCDEPVSALDVSVQAQILNLLMDLQDDFSLTYVFITHDLSVIKHISDQIMIMYLGHCVEFAPSNEIFAKPAHPYTEALLASVLMPVSGQKGKKLSIIKGELRSAINPPPGCRFAPRCPDAAAECLAADVELAAISPDHLVACRKWGSACPKNDLDPSTKHF